MMLKDHICLPPLPSSWQVAGRYRGWWWGGRRTKSEQFEGRNKERKAGRILEPSKSKKDVETQTSREKYPSGEMTAGEWGVLWYWDTG